MTQRNDPFVAGSVEARLLQMLMEEGLRALQEMSPVHWLFIAEGGHWAVWMRSAAEPEFVIEFAVGNEAQPHEADTEEPNFIAYLRAPQSRSAASLLLLLASFGNIVRPFVGGEVEWTLVGSLEYSMDIADAVLNLHADRVAMLRQQMIEDLPRTLSVSVDAVLRHVKMHALPLAVLNLHGSLH
jgi:hypothetical protein